MKDLSENNVIRFVNISRKKEILYANFRVKGIRNGVVFSASISVDISALELHPGDSLEKIVEESARYGLQEFGKAHFQVEGVPQYLGVAQLG